LGSPTVLSAIPSLDAVNMRDRTQHDPSKYLRAVSSRTMRFNFWREHFEINDGSDIRMSRGLGFSVRSFHRSHFYCLALALAGFL
jgi:hypothetical protein